MKKILMLLALLPLSLAGFAQSLTLMGEGDGTVTVGLDFETKNKKTATAYAERYIIETLLYRGIPGSAENKPMVGTNEQAISEKHGAYLKAMLDEKTGRYHSFVVASTSTVKKKKANAVVTVNTRALRADLMQQGLIRKFGF